MTLRDHLWQGRDLTGKLAVIRSVAPGRAPYPKGTRSPVWSRATALVFPTGPAVLLSVEATIAQQADWLARENPDYLLTLPTNLSHLAEHCIERGVALPKLRGIATLGGILRPQTRAASRRAWNAPVSDFYSAQEVGYLALQCPQHEHYHVQAETVLVEVLDARGRPCPSGTTGRVVVTPLHNFAMPLLRYEIGDYAEVGAPCPCGRGLPVLAGIAGRARNMLTMPSGETISPTFVNDWFEGFPVVQFQVVQRARDHLEFRIVPRRPFSAVEEARVRALVAWRLGPAFRVSLTYQADIPRGPGGKYEDFRSELEPAGDASSDR